jgi:hypothetical protein
MPRVPSKQYVPLFAGFACIVFGSDRAKGNNPGKLADGGFFFRNNQVSSAYSAANTENGSFYNNFIQVDQWHSFPKGGLGLLYGQKKGMNVPVPGRNAESL